MSAALGCLMEVLQTGQNKSHSKFVLMVNSNLSVHKPGVLHQIHDLVFIVYSKINKKSISTIQNVLIDLENDIKKYVIQYI